MRFNVRGHRQATRAAKRQPDVAYTCRPTCWITNLLSARICCDLTFDMSGSRLLDVRSMEVLTPHAHKYALFVGVGFHRKKAEAAVERYRDGVITVNPQRDRVRTSTTHRLPDEEFA